MGETPDQLAQGRADRGIRVGDRILSGTDPATENTVLQADSSGDVAANTSVILSEISAPSAPTSAGRLYVADVSGSTALYFLPPGGDGAVLLAIET